MNYFLNTPEDITVQKQTEHVTTHQPGVASHESEERFNYFTELAHFCTSY